MTNESNNVAQANQRLSALADGEIDVSEVESVIDDWRTSPVSRRAWHDYHLIGDVLRSDDFAAAAPGDAAFLEAVRRRLATEPIVLAPAQMPALDAPKRQRAAGARRFAPYAAIAAGFLVVVAGTLTITGLPFTTSNPPAGSIALRPDGSAASSAGSKLAAASDATDPLHQGEATVASGQLIRDAGLDRYLAAHHQWSSNARLGGHAVYLRPGSVGRPGR